MTNTERMDYLLRFHANLSLQLTAQLAGGHQVLNRQLDKVEKEIESILFPEEPTL